MKYPKRNQYKYAKSPYRVRYPTSTSIVSACAAADTHVSYAAIHALHVSRESLGSRAARA